MKSNDNAGGIFDRPGRTLSAYYKEIVDMYHMLNRFNTVGDTLLQDFGIQWASQMRTAPYDLTLPYNSQKPTKVWGFEFEHQMNFRFLPGLLKNLVLSYNASIVRSEAFIWGSQIDSVFHQGDHNVSYSASGLSDGVTNAFTRIDLALRQGITNDLALFMNVSNATDVEDGSSTVNRVFDRKLFNQSEKYGLTAGFGVTVKLE